MTVPCPVYTLSCLKKAVLDAAALTGLWSGKTGIKEKVVMFAMRPFLEPC